MLGFKKRIKSEMSEQGGKIIKAVSIQTFIWITIILHVMVIYASVKGFMFPDAEMIVNLVGTCAEIIAGLYGITMAGYTFFLSRMDALMATDMTLDYVVNSVKIRYKYIIWCITFYVLITLFTSSAIMYYPMPTGEITFGYRLFCNEFLIFMAASVVMILYYSVSVIEPKRIEKEAARQKKKLSRMGKEGDILEFISLYDKIEQQCNARIPQNVLSQIHENKGKHFEYTIDLLYQSNVMLRPVIPELMRIHRYYECMVNCSPMAVSQEMCTAAKHVLAFLEGTT